MKASMVVMVVCVALTLGHQTEGSGLKITCSYRKDSFLPHDEFPEEGADPVDGGRVMMAVTLPPTTHSGQAGGIQPGDVSVNGVGLGNLTQSDPTMEFVDWASVRQVTATVVAISFHSRNTGWLPSPPDSPVPLNVSIVLGDDEKTHVAWGTCTPAVSSLVATWITPVEMDEQTLAASPKWVLHLSNSGRAPCSVDKLVFNGAGVELEKTTPLPVEVPPGSRIIVPFSTTTSSGVLVRGQPFAVEVYGSCGVHAYVGRTPDGVFPFELWPCSSDCPLPGANTKFWDTLHAAGIDTVFYPGSQFDHKCSHLTNGTSLVDLVASPGFAEAGAAVWTDPDTAAAILKTNPSAGRCVGAAFLGDETDGKIGPGLRQILETAREVEATTPTVLTYQGGKTNRHNGAFAGSTDIQGMDAYIGACAPTIINVLHEFKPQYSYAYLANARANMMPLPTATYSQLYSHAWGSQAHGPTLAVELASVLAAGAKGLTLFQACQDLIAANSAAWEGPVTSVMRSMYALRAIARVGDVGGLPLTWSDQNGNPGDYGVRSLPVVIRDPQTILIAVLNFDADGYSNLLCHIDAFKHWDWHDHTVDKIAIQLTPDVASVSLDSLVEWIDGTPHPIPSSPSSPFSLSNSTLTITNLHLSASTPVRFFSLSYSLSWR